VADVSDADDRVRRYILKRWHNENPDHADCSTLHVVTAETQFALFYDTGVEGVAFTAELACEHREQFDYEFGELGELPDIIQALDEETGS
jgi:hypothetical protein